MSSGQEKLEMYFTAFPIPASVLPVQWLDRIFLDVASTILCWHYNAPAYSGGLHFFAPFNTYLILNTVKCVDIFQQKVLHHNYKQISLWRRTHVSIVPKDKTWRRTSDFRRTHVSIVSLKIIRLIGWSSN